MRSAGRYSNEHLNAGKEGEDEGSAVGLREKKVDYLAAERAVRTLRVLTRMSLNNPPSPTQNHDVQSGHPVELKCDKS